MIRYSEGQKVDGELDKTYQLIKGAKNIPLLLPSWWAFKATLDSQWGEPVRNLTYMVRIMRRLPTFVWYSQIRLQDSEITQAYNIDIEFYHATNQQQLELFLATFVEDVIVVTDYQTALSPMDWIIQLAADRKIVNWFIYVRSQRERLALSNRFTKQFIHSLGLELFQMVQTFQTHDRFKENPKIILMQGLSHFEKIFLNIMHKNIDRERGVMKFVALAKQFLLSPKKQPKNEKELKERTKLSKEIKQFENTYPRTFNPESEQDALKVINWYTKIGFCYKLLNTVVRGTDDPYTLAYVELLIQDITKAIRYLSIKQNGRYFGKQFIGRPLYRRTFLSNAEVRSLTFRKKIVLGGFVSTSLDIKSAQIFGGTALFIITTTTGDKKNNSFCFTPTNESEEEILFVPGCVFEVMGTTIEYKKHKIFKKVQNSEDQIVEEFTEKISIINLKFRGHASDYLEEERVERRRDIEAEINQRMKEKLQKLGVESRNQFTNIFSCLVSKRLKETLHSLVSLYRAEQKQMILMKSGIWERFYARHNQEEIKVELPSKEVIADTLIQSKKREDSFTRSEEYVKKILELKTMCFCFVWLSCQTIPEHIVSSLYLKAIDVYHVKTISEMDSVTRKLFPRWVFAIIEIPNIERVFDLYLKSVNLIKVFVRRSTEATEATEAIIKQYPEISFFSEVQEIIDNSLQIKQLKFASKRAIIDLSLQFSWQIRNITQYLRCLLTTNLHRQTSEDLEQKYPLAIINQFLDGHAFNDRSFRTKPYKFQKIIFLKKNLAPQQLQCFKAGDIVQSAGFWKGSYDSGTLVFGMAILVNSEALCDQGFGYPFQQVRIKGESVIALNPLNIYRISQRSTKTIQYLEFLTNVASKFQNVFPPYLDEKEHEYSRIQKIYATSMEREEETRQNKLVAIEQLSLSQSYRLLYDLKNGNAGLQLFKKCDLSNIKRLGLSHQKIDYQGIKVLKLTWLPGLQELTLIGNPIGDNGAKHLFEFCCHKLTKLQLQGCKISLRGAAYCISMWSPLRTLEMDPECSSLSLTLINCQLQSVFFDSWRAPASIKKVIQKAQKVYRQKKQNTLVHST